MWPKGHPAIPRIAEFPEIRNPHIELYRGFSSGYDIATAGAYIVGGKPPPGIPRGGFFLACINYGNPLTQGTVPKPSVTITKETAVKCTLPVSPVTDVVFRKRGVADLYVHAGALLVAQGHVTTVERDAHRHVRALHPDRPTPALIDPQHGACRSTLGQRRTTMRRIGVLTGVTAIAAGLVFGVSPGAAGDQERVISLLSVQQGGSLIDIDRSGGDGPTLGDQYIFTDGLYKWHGTKRGKRIGTTHGIATITSPTTAFFTGTMSLPTGYPGRRLFQLHRTRRDDHRARWNRAVQQRRRRSHDHEARQ